MAEIEKTNEIEKSEEPANIGEKVAITNPIEAPDEEPVIYYSDQPGAGPEDEAEEEDEDEEDDDLTDEELDEAAKQAAATEKALKSVPENKAVKQASEQTK